jgi:hypothetical protein
MTVKILIENVDYQKDLPLKLLFLKCICINNETIYMYIMYIKYNTRALPVVKFASQHGRKNTLRYYHVYESSLMT